MASCTAFLRVKDLAATIEWYEEIGLPVPPQITFYGRKEINFQDLSG